MVFDLEINSEKKLKV